MSKEVDIVAIIPARAGSKRLPGKNILPLGGKPVIQWTIEQAKNIKAIDLVVVTSDDKKVIDIANKNNVLAINRPRELSTDTASTVDVIKHVLDYLKVSGINTKRVMLLQPTSPLRNDEDIIGVIDTMIAKDANSIVTVCEVEHPIQWCNVLPADHSMEEFIKHEYKNKRSQDLDVHYRLNGSIYLTKTTSFYECSGFMPLGTYSYIMPPSRSIDIDNIIDYQLCILITEGLKNEEKH